MTNVIPLLTVEARLKRLVRANLRRLGFVRKEGEWLTPSSSCKDAIRSLHQEHRSTRLAKESSFLRKNARSLLRFFANGADIVPEQVRPVLVPVTAGTLESDLFRFATSLWSVPVSGGYGRRLRYLVIDDSTGYLMGLFGLGDPVFNLAARDQWIGWSSHDRGLRLANVMDCYVLGAVPPYRELLGGKIVACMAKSQEVSESFAHKYGSRVGVISKENKHASLALITITSALGRSSLYNRLRLDGTTYFEELGFTKGWGHFHISEELFEEIRDYLSRRRHAYADHNRFGDGPNLRLRVIREGLHALGFDANLLKHGIGRQVFRAELGTNVPQFLRGDATLVPAGLLNAKSIGLLGRDRWLVPRALRQPQYIHHRKEAAFAQILVARAKLDDFSSKASS